jgi:hypothetical protein
MRLNALSDAYPSLSARMAIGVASWISARLAIRMRQCVSQGLAIRGTFDGRVGAVELTVDAIAGINARTIFYAGRQIYAENDRFRLLDKDLALRRGQDLLSTLMQP